jgi:organic radical activating enzyme
VKTPINSQRITKPVKGDGVYLTVHSIFWTIQGEGPFSGRAAVFLRLADCNLQCPFCDTEYTEGAREMLARDVMAIVEDKAPEHIGRGRKLLVITGGEPFRQNLSLIIFMAKIAGWHVQVETNGVLAPQSVDDIVKFVSQGDLTIVVSPKTARVNEALATVASAFKYVLANDSLNTDDGLPLQALGNKCSPHVARPPAGFRGTVYVNPMDAKDEWENLANIKACARSAMRFGYTMGLQIHKYIGLE